MFDGSQNGIVELTFADHVRITAGFSFVAGTGIPANRVLGVGISVPGILSDDHKTVVYATVLGFTGGTLEQFAQYIPFPCVMCNDANAAGTAEMWNEREHGNIVYLSLSNTVGGSIFVDNNLYTASEGLTILFLAILSAS